MLQGIRIKLLSLATLKGIDELESTPKPHTPWLEPSHAEKPGPGWAGMHLK